MKTANTISLFAPNSQQLVLVSADNRIRIWSTTNNSVEHEILTNEIESNITFVHYNPSPSKKQEKLVVIGTEKGTIYLWNLSTARVQLKLDQSKGNHNQQYNLFLMTSKMVTLIKSLGLSFWLIILFYIPVLLMDSSANGI
jgi:WD40 repeat protein